MGRAVPLLAAIGVLAGTAAREARAERGGIVSAGRSVRTARALDPAGSIAGWRATRDRDTGAIAQLWGGKSDAIGAVGDAAIAERAARGFLAAHVAELAPGAAASEFVVVANRLDGPSGKQIRTVGFRQTSGGATIVGAQLGIVFEADHLFAVSSTALPAPAPMQARAIAAARATAPAAHTALAEAWLLAATGHRARTHARGDRVILPLVHAPGDLEFRVADELDVASLDSPDRWTVWVAPDGTPLARRARYFDVASATLQFNAGVRYATGTRANAPAVAANLTVNGVATTTDANGVFAITGTQPAAIAPSAIGSNVIVTNQAGSAATDALSASNLDTIVWDHRDDELTDAQISTFVYATTVIARDTLINPAVASWLASPITFFVNEPGGCNAYSTGIETHFFVANAECQNTGRLADVVYHEFGHSLHYHSIIPGMGMFDQAMSEGLADFNAANLNEDSGIGRGFYYTNDPLREIDPVGYERAWPGDNNNDPHIAGEIISGALWDLRKTFIAELGHDAGVALAEQIYTGVMQRAPDITGTYMAALIADDDDGDLSNGTPHYCDIQHAFGIHGLAEADFATTSLGAVAVDGSSLALSVPVTTPAGAACPVPHVASIEVTWQVGDQVASTFELAPSADGTTWSGAFPAQPDGTIIVYAVDARLDDDEEIVLPYNPADPMYQLFVGTGLPIWCEHFETDPHWVQTDKYGTEWSVGAPDTNPASHHPTAAHGGTNLLGMNIVGDGYYQANDMTSIVSPAIPVGSYDIVHLQYWRWLSVEDALYDVATIEVDDAQVWQNAYSPAGTLDHIDREWRFHDVDITGNIVDGAAAVRWSLTSDSSLQLGGWSIDDVCLVGASKHAVCGDGVLDPGEQCDDGNTTSGDGCSATCVDEVEAGGGGCATGGGAGSWAPALGLGLLMRRRRRRRC